MNLDLARVAEGRILSGALAGRRVFARLVEQTSSEPARPTPLFLNFSDVDVATASFLRESIVAFRDFVRRQRSAFYPVVANANDSVREELAEVLRTNGGAIMACTLSGTGVADAVPIGELQPKQQMTFDLVVERGVTDAAELMRDCGATEGMQGVTAWNNRLSNLVSLGLVMEVSQGRSKRYRSLFEGMHRGE